MIYQETPKESHHLLEDWFKKVITYDLSIEESSYIALENGTYEIIATIKSKRFETLSNGEIIEVGIKDLKNSIKTPIARQPPIQIFCLTKLMAEEIYVVSSKISLRSKPLSLKIF